MRRKVEGLRPHVRLKYKFPAYCVLVQEGGTQVLLLSCGRKEPSNDAGNSAKCRDFMWVLSTLTYLICLMVLKTTFIRLLRSSGFFMRNTVIVLHIAANIKSCSWSPLSPSRCVCSAAVVGRVAVFVIPAGNAIFAPPPSPASVRQSVRPSVRE